MQSEMAYCKILPDSGNIISNWVCEMLGFDNSWVGDNYTIGIELEGKMIAGIIFNNYRKNCDVTLTIYSNNPRWCNKRILKYVFGVCFNKLNCRRVSVLVSKDNAKSLKLCKHLGFKVEGLLRQFRDNGEDCYFMGMLKTENKWNE